MTGDAAGPLAPLPYRVVGRQREAADVTTLSLQPLSGPPIRHRPGQFTMLTAFGVGESAVSVSSPPAADGRLEQTVRAVGPVTRALCGTDVGGIVGVRGPFGTDWGVQDLVGGDGDGPTGGDGDGSTGGDGAGPSGDRPAGGAGGDVVVVAGGIGLAPLRGAVAALVAAGPGAASRVFVLVGARQPDQVIFGDDLRAWSAAGAHVAVTVDLGAPGWTGNVGLVTSLLDRAGFDPARTTAMVCGPEVMMRFTARQLVDLGVDPGRIRVSMERNMQCGVAWCGHCQLGPFLLCRDGPVLPYADVAPLLGQRER